MMPFKRSAGTVGLINCDTSGTLVYCKKQKSPVFIGSLLQIDSANIVYPTNLLSFSIELNSNTNRFYQLGITTYALTIFLIKLIVEMTLPGPAVQIEVALMA